MSIIKTSIAVVFAIFFVGESAGAFSNKELESAKKEMIRISISSYRGPCPCPYNVMRNGRSCGKRSAYSRPGGASPLCYPGDIADVDALRFLKKEGSY